MGETVEIDFDEITRVTDEAIQLDGKTWLPRSQIVDGEHLELGDGGPIEVAEWIAIEKGLV